MSNVIKATIIVFGVLALVGFVALLWPLFAALGEVFFAIFSVLLPVILIPVAIYVVYRILSRE